MAATKVLHIITSLHADGAQNMLLKLVQNRDQAITEYLVVSLLDKGVLGTEIEKAGVSVECLELKKPINIFSKLFKIKKIIREFAPNIIQGWMYHANLFGLVVFKVFCNSKHAKLMWNIRRDLDGMKHDKFLTKIVIRLNALFSNIPSAIIYCGHKVAKDHFAIGYNQNNSIVIPNGFQCDKFLPSEKKYLEFRKALGLLETSTIVGMIGRFHSQKNHKNFVEMADLVLKDKPNINFILVGRDCTWDNLELKNWINNTISPKSFYLLGQRSDIPEILPAFDVFCLSSSAEGFPNVLGEAMASGVVAVSTTAGASQEIIDDIKRVAPINDSRSLADKVLYVLNLNKEEIENIKDKSRNRVLNFYSIEKVSNTYQEKYGSISRE